MKTKPDSLDVVELREARGGQPVGATGAVVELFATEALVEIADEDGKTFELLSVPYDELGIRESEPAARRAPG